MRAKEFIFKEARPVWRRNPSTGHIQLFWRCEGGQRNNRTVPNVSDCNQAFNIGQSQNLKKTRAKTWRKQNWKSNLTKKRSKASRLVQKLNKWGVAGRKNKSKMRSKTRSALGRTIGTKKRR